MIKAVAVSRVGDGHVLANVKASALADPTEVREEIEKQADSWRPLGLRVDLQIELVAC